MKTLIIYEEVPEKTRLFLVEGDRSDLHGMFVNMTENIPSQIYDQLCEPTMFFGPELPDAPHFIPEAPVLVVVCGFIL